MNLSRQVFKAVIFLLVCGLFASIVSLLYQQVEVYHLATICIYGELTVTKASSVFGFPLFFVDRTDWVIMIGCGPVLRQFSNYSFNSFGLLVDTVFYTLVVTPLFLLIRHRSAKKIDSPPISER